MNKKILLVEDDKIQSDMYKVLLENHGYMVDQEFDGSAGLKNALDNHPDLLILDIRMPEKDGLTLLHELRLDEWGKTARVIMLTNFDSDDEILNKISQDLPTYYFIKAKIKPDELLDKINSLFEE